jgi:hypothetical protein
MKTFAQLIFEINPFIINRGLLKFKIWTSELTILLINSRNQLNFIQNFIYIYFYHLKPWKSWQVVIFSFIKMLRKI